MENRNLFGQVKQQGTRECPFSCTGLQTPHPDDRLMGRETSPRKSIT